MQEHRERRERLAARAKPDTPILCLSASARSQRVEVPPVIELKPPVQTWPERQIQLYQPWFSIEDEVEPKLANPPSMGAIQRICAAYYSITLTELLSDRRMMNLVRARQVAIFLCKEFTLRSMPEIGRRFSGRDHTTVLHAIRKIARLSSEDNDMADDLAKLRQLIREGA